MSKTSKILVTVLCLFSKIALVGLDDLQAQESAQNTAVLSDINGDGKVSILAFGDSLTYGVGDGTSPGDEVTRETVPFTNGTLGYTKRLQALLSVPVANAGVPGEEISKGGLQRLPSVSKSGVDIVTFLEGINDVLNLVADGNYEMYLQKAINIMQVNGKTPVLGTLPKTCCDHEGQAGGAESYSAVVRRVGAGNGLAVADIAKAWELTCKNKLECELYNLPEGLHPNSVGYAVMAQTFAASLLGINIFAQDGAQQLADATGRPVTDILVKPEAVVASTTE